MKKIFLYLIGLLILGLILLLIFTQLSINQKNTQGKINSQIYDATDKSVNDFLSQNRSQNQTSGLYDSVDASVEQFLNK